VLVAGARPLPTVELGAAGVVVGRAFDIVGMTIASVAVSALGGSYLPPYLHCLCQYGRLGLTNVCYSPSRTVIPCRIQIGDLGRDGDDWCVGRRLRTGVGGGHVPLGVQSVIAEELIVRPSRRGIRTSRVFVVKADRYRQYQVGEIVRNSAISGSPVLVSRVIDQTR